MGENPGSKLDKANKLGLAVIGFEEFLRMIGRARRWTDSRPQASNMRRF